MRRPKSEKVPTFAEKEPTFAEKEPTFAEKVPTFAEGHFCNLRQHKHLRGVFFPDYPDYSDYPRGVGSREMRPGRPPLCSGAPVLTYKQKQKPRHRGGGSTKTDDTFMTVVRSHTRSRKIGVFGGMPIKWRKTAICHGISINPATSSQLIGRQWAA